MGNNDRIKVDTKKDNSVDTFLGTFSRGLKSDHGGGGSKFTTHILPPFSDLQGTSRGRLNANVVFTFFSQNQV